MTAALDTKDAGNQAPGIALPASGALWLALATAGCIAFFWDGLVSLLEAWSRPEYSHGPLIPVIAGFLFFRELRNRPVPSATGGQIPGMVALALGLSVGLLGNLTQIPYLITYGLIVVIGGLILLAAGTRHGARQWVAWVYLLFMLPLPNFIYWQLSVKLQFISSRLGVDFIQTLGIPVFLDGNIIDLGIYQLQVAEACNGLRYLFPLMSFGFLFAALYRGPAWHKVILFLSTMPITILMNSLRIGVIGVLVNSYGISQAEGFLHWFEGWIIFVACIVLLYIEATLLHLLVAQPRTVLASLDLDTEGMLGSLRSFATRPARKGLMGAALLLVVAGSLWQLLPARSAPLVAREILAVFPLELDGWRGARHTLDPTIEQVLGADEYLLADYVSPDGRDTVNLFVSYYHSTTDGSGIHSPEICIPGGGWEVSGWQQATVATGAAGADPFTVNRAIIQKGERKQLVYYWFEQRGRRLTSEYQTKLFTVWDSFARGRADGALMRVVTPLEQGEPEAAADRRLSAFLGPILGLIPRYVPE